MRKFLISGMAIAAGQMFLPLANAGTPGVYHPYVNQAEREIEYGLVRRDLGGDAVNLQRASFGYSWTDNLATEFYVLSEFPTHDQARARAVEVEVRWQLTEQGEYASDWGLLFEAEIGTDTDRHALAAGVLWEKELGHRFVAAANALVEVEFGSAIENEIETEFRGQLRYLKHPLFEPAIELYSDDIDKAIGPVVLGTARIAEGRKIHWEAGMLFGLDRATPDRSLRLGIEFEF
ncbi:MAG: hypothetical protein IPK97_15970 [Ahniella sp.]|nr:hypothetical protein [Ahniella sp.]